MLRIPPLNNPVIAPSRTSETVSPTQTVSTKVEKEASDQERRQRRNRRKAENKTKPVIERRVSTDRRKPEFDVEV
jgi:hypothetical protein